MGDTYHYAVGAIASTLSDAQLLGVTRIPAGTAAAPSLAIRGDADTGLYSRTANGLSIATGGGERLRVDDVAATALGNLGVVGRLAVGLPAGTAGNDLVHLRETGADPLSTQLLVENYTNNTGGAGIGFQVAHVTEYSQFGPKAGIIYERAAANGRGPLKFLNRSVNDSAGFAASDERLRIANDGTVTVGGPPGAEGLRVSYVSSANRAVSIQGANGGNPVIGTTAGNLALQPSGGTVQVTGALSATGALAASTLALQTSYVAPAGGGVIDMDMAAAIHLVSGFGGDTMIRLPAAAAWNGHVRTIKRVNAAGGTVTVAVVAGGLIDDTGAGIPLAGYGAHVSVISNGAQWFIIGRHGA